MAQSQMPKDVEARIRALPGNNVCADCQNIKPQWASVSYGALVCLECSGQHRSLGVHLSFVRSVAMDSWTERQIAAMEKSGGNAKLVEYLQSRGIDKTMKIATKYNTKQAAYYRERLTRWLDGKTEPPPDPGRYDPVTGDSEAQGAEPLPGETTDEYNARQARLREAARERMRQKFGNGGMMGGVGPGGSISGGAPLGDEPSGIGGLVGGAVSGMGSFLKNNVLENEGLRSTVGGAVTSLGGVADGIRRSVTDGSLLDTLKSNGEDDNVMKKGIGLVSGAVGAVWDKAPSLRNTSSSDSRLTAQLGRNDLDDFWNQHFGDGRSREGSDKETPKEPNRGPQSKKENLFNDDDWGDWHDEAAKEDAKPPPEPTQEDLERMKRELGMKLEEPAAPAPPATVSPTKPVKPPVMETSKAFEPVKKSPAKLASADDFFDEFGV